MMIVQACIVLILAISTTCHPLESIRIPKIDVSPPEEVNSLERRNSARSPSNSFENNVEGTIKEVEDLIKADASLPRLTRGEILDIIENITHHDEENSNKHRRDPKAIMVVMPFTPSSSDNNNMEELFTKQPVTHIIGAEPFQTNKKRKQLPQHREPTSSTPAQTTHHRRRRPHTTTESSSVTTPTVTRTRRPVRRRTTTVAPIKHPNHKYSEEDETDSTRKNVVKNRGTQKFKLETASSERSEEFVSGGMRIVEAPKFSQIPANLPDLNSEETVRQEVVLKQEIPVALPDSKEKLERTTTATPLMDDIHLPDNLKSVFNDLNLDTAMKPTEKPKIDVVTTVKSTTEIAHPQVELSTKLPDVSSVADSLSPEMRQLLMSFGLLPDPNESKPKPENVSRYIPDKATIDPESYVGFKPLPNDDSSRNDMDALLASFGLGRSSRKQKSLKHGKTEENKQLNFDVVPANLKGVLTELGLVDRQSKKMRTPTIDKTVEKQHVFNPDTQYATDEELAKLAKLMDAVKQLEKLNRSITEDDLKTLPLADFKELVNSFNTHSNGLVTLDQNSGPDPNNFDVGLIKNEIKRQSTTTSTTTTSTEEPKTPSLTDLEDSFGGQTSSEAPPEPTTPSQRTGFYYLVDWNTFFDIDDQKGKRVNLRLQPTIGDPKRFLSVTVP